MRKYIVYNATGKIDRYGVSANIDVVLQAGPGEFVKVVNKLGNKFDTTHKVKRGVTPDKDEVVEIAKKPK